MSMLLVTIGVILLIIAIPFIKSSTTKGFTRGVAKAQLRTYKNLKKRNPELSNRDLYFEMISCRPGYSRFEAEEIIKRTEGISNSPLLKNLPNFKEKKDVTLRDVVVNLVQHEFVKRTGQFMGNKRYSKMYDEVIKIIPEDL